MKIDDLDDRRRAFETRPGENPVTREQVVARRRRIRHELELPVKEDDSAFLWNLIIAR